MSRHQEAPQFHNHLDSLMQGSEARKRMIEECLQGKPSITDLQRIISHPRTSRLAQLAGVLLIASYTTAVGLPSHTTQAETLKTSTPKPITEVGSMPSQVALQETATPQEAIILTSSSIPYEWEYTEAGVRKGISWSISNAEWGIPPNDPDVIVGTVRVMIDNVNSPSFQTKNSLYKEITDGTATRTVIGGTVVDKETMVGFMASRVVIDNIKYQRVERIRDARNPIDYSDEARVLMEDNILGNIAQGGLLGGFYEGLDQQGKYLDIVISEAIDPSKNGTYRQRLDNQCNFVGIPYKVNQAQSTHRIYIPVILK